jgi:hypothetical protein
VVADSTGRFTNAIATTEAMREVLAPRRRDAFADTEPELPDTRPSLPTTAAGTVALPEALAELQSALVAMARAEHDGDLSRAITFGERALALDPTRADVLTRTATLYVTRAHERDRCGDHNGAWGDVLRALTLAPSLASAWNLRTALQARNTP